MDKNQSLLSIKIKILGILSDGDIRRALLKGKNLKSRIEKIYNQKSYFQKYNKLSLSKINENFKKKKFDLIPILKNNKVIKIFLDLALI